MTPRRLPTEWSDARTAAHFLECTPKHLNEELGTLLLRESANRPGAATARSGGWLYHRHDLELVREVMDRLGCKPLVAARTLHAVRRLHELEVLPLLIARPVVYTAPRRVR